MTHTAVLEAPRAARLQIRRSLRSYGVVAVFIALCVVFTASSEFFLTWPNWLNILRQSSINAVLAVGVCFVVLTKGIDLSVGSVMALAGAIAASIAISPDGYGMWLVIPVGLGVGMALGTVNGVLVAKMNVPSFVVTLGMLSIARGLTLIYTDGQPIPNLPPAFRAIGSSTVLGVPAPAVILAIVFALAWVILVKTPLGRYIYAVGGNEKAARTSGIPVDRIKIIAYAVSGTLAGLAGMILAARTSAALPQAGVGYELDAIAAVVIGGASLAGGRGSILGTLFGALIIGTINNGLDLLGISSYYQQLFKGLIIVLAVMLDFSRSKSS